MKILQYIKNYLNLIQKKFISKKYFYSYAGIDLLVSDIFKNINNGIYIDVGAQHPIKNNNTYLLNKKGWKGINIDLDQKNIDLFNIARRNDLNIVAAVDSKINERNLYFYHDKSPINTLSKNLSDYNKAVVKEIKHIKTTTLDIILKNSTFKDSSIDFLSIDVEGFELEVIKGLNLNIYRPKIIVVEFLDLKTKKLEIKNLNIERVLDSLIHKYMVSKNYILVNWLHSDLIYASRDFID